ncbi:MAG TPA: Gfo/Idh/MocA family oxidoreductase [Solirubrobacteraceae bacterium]|nr:Gfo/Idh/MocA family oxidoreductase [Solirubrobacteraceae bacterium]
MEREPPVRLGLIGLGYWGPNLLRAAADLEDVELAAICDLDPERLAMQRRRNPYLKLTTDVDDLLQEDSLDGVLIASPAETHHELALRCLKGGKHVFVEKPMAQTTEQCLDLIGCAAERELILMPGHTFLYSPPVVAIKEILDRQDLGPIYFVTSTRVNLGIHRANSNVVQDLAPHDFSILQYWMGTPLFVRAIGRDSIVRSEWDVVFVDLGYPTGTLVRVELSWLAPSKIRRTVIAGRNAMLVYEDTSPEPIRIHDCSAEVVDGATIGAHRVSYRTGDILSPRLSAEEPLRAELADFAASIRTGEPPRSDMRLGMEVVRMVEAAELSLHRSGSAVPLNLPPGEQRMTPDRRRSNHGMPWFDGPTTLAQPAARREPGMDESPAAQRSGEEDPQPA